MRKAAAAALFACSLVLTGGALAGCAGLPSTQAPEPTSSYVTFSAGESSSEECKIAVERINSLSKTLAQITESLDRGEMLELVGLASQLQTQAGELGDGLSGDAELQQQVEGIQSAIAAMSSELQNADPSNPQDLLAAVQDEAAKVQQHVAAISDYCSS